MRTRGGAHTPLALALLACLRGGALGQVSSGGPYDLGLSVVSGGGGTDLAGGAYRAQGAAGQALLPGSSSDSIAAGPYVVRRGFYNPPRFSLQNALANTLSDPTNSVTLSLPAFSVPSATFEVAFRQNPVDNPLRVDPDKVRQADQTLARNDPGSQILPDSVWEIDVMDETGLHDQALASQGAISFRYRDASGNGIVDGTNPPVRAKTLSPWILDENLGLWIKLPAASVDLGSRRVATPLRHLSVFAFIGGLDTSVADVYAFPVPFRPHGPDAGTGPGQTGTTASGITFTNLPSDGVIEIYTLTGQLVRRLDIPMSLAVPSLVWDVANLRGEAVASGVYIWRAVSHGGSKTGRLMVIR